EAAERRFELLDRLDVEMVRRLVEDEAVDAPGDEEGERCARPLPRRKSSGAPEDLTRPEAELRKQCPCFAVRQAGAACERAEKRYLRGEGRPALVELAQDDSRPHVAAALGERDAAEERVEQRRLAASVR